MSRAEVAGAAAREAVRAKLLGCCGSESWVAKVAADWPPLSVEQFLGASERAFDSLSPEDWRQAFRVHARIGQPTRGDAQGAAEQAGVATAAESELAELARLNADYEERFGHVFLICASGLSAAEMLAALRERILNSGATEFKIAQREQRKITALRIRSACDSGAIATGTISS